MRGGHLAQYSSGHQIGLPAQGFFRHETEEGEQAFAQGCGGQDLSVMHWDCKSLHNRPATATRQRTRMARWTGDMGFTPWMESLVDKRRLAFTQACHKG